MSRFADIQYAFDGKLSTLSSGSLDTSKDVAWPNVPFNPSSSGRDNRDDPWLRPTLLVGDSNHQTLDGTQREVGIYQVDIFIEREKGPDALLDLMDDIYAHFNDVDLTVGTTDIYVGAVGRTPIRQEESWLVGSLEIQYHSYY